MNMSNRIVYSIFPIIIIVCYAAACSTRNTSEGEQDELKLEQYYVQGQVLYNKHCSNCHQRDGSGLKQLYPPLDSSDFMDNNLEATLCLIRYGVSGEMVVNDIQYNQAMPGIPQLTPLEIAEIATYIYNRGAHNSGLIELTYVDSVLNRCR